MFATALYSCLSLLLFIHFRFNLLTNPAENLPFFQNLVKIISDKIKVISFIVADPTPVMLLYLEN